LEGQGEGPAIPPPRDGRRDLPQVARARRRLEEGEQEAVLAEVRRDRVELAHSCTLAALAPVLGGGANRRGDGARRRPADLAEAVVLGELAGGPGIHHAARDAALHDEVARRERARVHGRVILTSQTPGDSRKTLQIARNTKKP
jgi:hypothetical protein